jgi:RNA polymerase sigma factor (sigma-70 family)
MTHQDLIPHLFRTEYRKITSVLCNLFGIEYIELAEDIASDCFLAAMETWPYSGTPENPTAWLYGVAKNKAKNRLNRDKNFAEKVLPGMPVPVSKDDFEIDLSEQNIQDSQLQMLFAICTPVISVEAQVGLALRILCGFGIEEIADAFLTNKETINKRLFRAREKLRSLGSPIEFPPVDQLSQRLSPVLTTLYLLFNEGYYSESQNVLVREDLCLEAMRLTHLLVSNPATNLSQVNALLSLMCFHASRFDARKGEHGSYILYADQDEKQWNQKLIGQGVYYFHKSASGNQFTKYHLEAGIAYWHTQKTDSAEKWSHILTLYNELLIIAHSPIALLNQTFALFKVHGYEAAIAQAEKISLSGNPYYHALLGELYKYCDKTTAKSHFQTAIALAKTDRDKFVLRTQIENLAR